MGCCVHPECCISWFATFSQFVINKVCDRESCCYQKVNAGLCVEMIGSSLICAWSRVCGEVLRESARGRRMKLLATVDSLLWLGISSAR